MIGFFWQDDDDFVQDGIQIEPFNLKQEREEGYFDADMNFVEFVNEKEIKVNIVVSDFVNTYFLVYFVFCFCLPLKSWTEVVLLLFP